MAGRYPNELKRSSCGIMANVMDCYIIAREFEHQSHFCIQFQTNIIIKAIDSFLSSSNVLVQSAGAAEYNDCPVYDSKYTNGEVPGMLELWRMQNTSLLPSLPGLLWPWVVAPDSVLFMV